MAARRQFEVGHAATFPAAFPRMLADFSSFVRTFQPSDFAQILADGRQVEQLWKIGETFRSIPVGNLETLPEVFEVLFPGRSHPGFWTPPELFLIRYTTFAQLLQTLLPGVPATLSAEHFCQFMVYTALPLVTFRRKVETLWRHGEFTLQSSDVFWRLQLHIVNCHGTLETYNDTRALEVPHWKTLRLHLCRCTNDLQDILGRSATRKHSAKNSRSCCRMLHGCCSTQPSKGFHAGCFHNIFEPHVLPNGPSEVLFARMWTMLHYILASTLEQ